MATLIVLGMLVGGASVVTAQDDSVSIVSDGEQVTVTPNDDAAIKGTSNLSADENLSVRVRASGDTEPAFLKTTEVSVGEEGNFTATFDFSDIPANSTFTVTVADDSGTLAEADGVVEKQAETTSEASTTDSVVPGFGPVTAVGALVALAAGALLVGRR
ncbi:BGTF surface domain-containing protein [Haloferax elongans]|uniref:BGTF surface domain-containing protein n=1 Tax=Haloferax elongans TaxID=403191 RepID=UPI000A43B18A|nr:BGTF surface domain-containing protein [Haloferax elongans]